MRGLAMGHFDLAAALADGIAVRERVACLQVKTKPGQRG